MEDGFMKRLGKLIDMPMPAKPRERKHSKTTKPKHEKSTMLNFVQQLQQSAFPNHPSSTPPQVVKKEEPITNVVGASSRVGGARRKQETTKDDQNQFPSNFITINWSSLPEHYFVRLYFYDPAL
ncbi:hypothetical protein OROMI_012419 [Orobanche minor]